MAVLIAGLGPAAQAATAPAPGDPTEGYLQAHRGLRSPMDLLGESTQALQLSVLQRGGTAYVALPDYRRLDPTVFGTPKMPRAVAGPPIAEGVPLDMRGVHDGHYTRLKQETPFGDKYIALSDANVDMEMIDATATDAATTKDTIAFTAKWRDSAGNTYTVKCNRPIAHGDVHPTFGGVVTNHLLHGFTHIGTPLMPTLFAYAAFWGQGTVWKNGKQLDGPRLVHAMLTEDPRLQGFKLAFDNQVQPDKLMLHLIVPPVKGGKQAPVHTGYMLKNGKELPFWHVMFTSFTVKVGRVGEPLHLYTTRHH